MGPLLHGGSSPQERMCILASRPRCKHRPLGKERISLFIVRLFSMVPGAGFPVWEAMEFISKAV